MTDQPQPYSERPEEFLHISMSEWDGVHEQLAAERLARQSAERKFNDLTREANDFLREDRIKLDAAEVRATEAERLLDQASDVRIDMAGEIVRLAAQVQQLREAMQSIEKRAKFSEKLEVDGGPAGVNYRPGGMQLAVIGAEARAALAATEPQREEPK